MATVRVLEAEANIQSALPGLAAVRSLALDGKWREIENSLILQSKKEGEECELLRKAKFSLAKQQYLEAAAGLDAICSYREPSTEELRQVRKFLERLEQLAPSKEEYDTLEALLDPQTDFFDKWNRQSARKETCDVLLEWLRMACFEGKCPVKKSGNVVEKETHQLTLLLAKGKIYEECEQVCREKCRRVAPRTPTALLDVSNWLQNQPDDFFQEAPQQIQVVSTALSTEPQSSTAVNSTDTPSTVGTETVQVNTTPAASPSQLHSVSKSKSATQMEKTVTDPVKIESGQNISKNPVEMSTLGCSQRSSPHTIISSPADRATRERITAHKEQVEMATNRARESLRETTSGDQITEELHTSQGAQAQLHKEHTDTVSSQHPSSTIQSSPQHSSKNRSSPQHPSTHQPPSSHHSSTTQQSPQHPVTTQPSPPPQQPVVSLPHPDPQPLGFTDNFTTQPPLWLLQTTPLVHSLQKEGRNSSTPKPSAHQILSSPPTSPVPHIPGADYSQATPMGQKCLSSERKQIDFDKEATDSQRIIEHPSSLSVSCPTATLTGKVTDTQV